MKAVFYVSDFETGCQLSDDFCCCINEFNTFNQAEKLCKRLSKVNKGKFTVNVAISEVIYKDGFLQEV